MYQWQYELKVVAVGRGPWGAQQAVLEVAIVRAVVLKRLCLVVPGFVSPAGCRLVPVK